MNKRYEKYWDIIVWVIHDEATPEQVEMIRRWREADPEHEHFFREVAALLEKMRSPQETPVFDETKGWDKLLQGMEQVSSRRFFIRRLLCYSLPAAALIILLLGMFGLFRPTGTGRSIQPGSQKAILILDDGAKIAIGNDPMHISRENADIRNDSISGLSFNIPKDSKEEKVTYSKLIIPQGGEYKLTLPDGTQVWLNSESELRFPSRFSKEKRMVEFTGEAYFKVAHCTECPFYVKTAGVEIKVYGTEFNLYAYEGEKELATTLVRGSVSVIPDGGEEVKIAPSQRLSYCRETKEISIKKVDTQLYTSWKDGVYIFENATLGGIFNYLKRWYVFEVDYAEENLKTMRFTGEFQKDKPVDYGLDLIRRTCEVNFRIEGSHIWVTR